MNTVEEHNVRDFLEANYGTVWNEEELKEEFKILSESSPPLILVERLSDGALGTLILRREPRLYFAFVPCQ